MTLEQQIQEDIKAAMKAKDTVAMNAVRAIKGEILLFKTAEGGSKEVTDGDILKMIQKLVKQRKEAAEQFVAAGRQELADNEQAEAAVMEKYLPKQLSEAEVEEKIKDIIAQVGATSIKDMGKVMGTANKALAGLSDGRTISTIVKKLLSEQLPCSTMKRFVLLLSVLMTFVFSANGQQNKYMLKPFDWSMHTYGDYQLQYLEKSPQGYPIDFVIKNKKTSQRVFPLYDKNNHLKPVEGNFGIVLWIDCVFIKASDGFANEFDGLVWMVPGEDKLLQYYRDKKWVSSYNNEKKWFSGVYKIEKDKKGKERLAPLLMDIDENGYSAVYPLGSLPYLVKYKNGESSVYNSDFELVNTYKGELLANSEGAFLYGNDGYTLFNEDLTPAATFNTEANGSIVFCKEGYVVWRSKGEYKVKVFDLSGNELWTKAFEKVLVCNGGPSVRYLAVKEKGKWGAYLLDNTCLLPCAFGSEKDLAAVVDDYKNWSYTSFVNNYVSKKGEFETTQHFNERQSDPVKQQEYIDSNNIKEKYVNSFSAYTLVLGPYNADTQEFMLIPTVADWNGFTIKVPLDEAEAFKNAFVEMRGDALKGAKYGIKYDSMAIEEITFIMPEGGKSYTFYNK